MKPRRIFSAARLSFPLAVALAALLSAPVAKAVTYTWTNLDDGVGTPISTTWSSGTSWSAVPMSAADTTLVFGYSFGPNSTAETNTLTNDIATPFQLNVLTLGINTPGAANGSSIALINIAGSPLNFVSNGSTTPQVNLSQNRSNGQVVSFDVQSNVVLTNNTLFTGNGTANFTVSGVISGAGAFTKSGTSTLTLSNASNSYNGGTTLSGGTLSVGVAAHLGDAASALTFDGGTLQITGTAINSFLGAGNIGRTVTFNSGKTVGLDINNAGNTFVADKVLNQGTGGLIKAGAGILQLSQVNTFTGNTAISAGTLSITGSGSLGSGTYAGAIGNNGTLIYSSSADQTLSGVISGTGALTKNTNTSTLTLSAANTFSGLTTVGTGTLVLTNALALQNSALVTTSGTTTLSGITGGLTVGGLSGATGNLGSANVLSGYTGNVSALTLNTVAAGPFTYGGIISNGSGTMSLTKTGTGTQILTGANSYTGATIVNAGTLTIGVGGSLSSSDLQMGGGTFSYGNTAAGQTLNGLTVGAGNSTLSNTATGQTLALGAITRTASIFGTVNFATLTGPISTTTGNAGSAGITGIIGPWATTGSGTSLRYAIGSADNVTATNILAFTGTTATAADLGNVTSSTTNYEYSAATTTATNLTANTLRYHTGGATATVIGAANTLTLNGLMNAGAGLLTISGGPTTGGILIGSTDELVIAANTQGTTISAAIGGTGRLVYSGAGTLLLSSTTSSYNGGTVINSGQLRVASDAALGNSTGSITLNGGTFVGNSTNPQSGNGGGVNISSLRDVIVGAAGGSMGAQGNNNFTTTGKLSGSGTLTFIELGGAGGRALNFNATNNDFTGRMIIESNSNTLSVNSLLDTAGSGNIALNLGAANSGSTFAYGSGATSPLALSNRAFELNASGAFTGTIQNNNTTQAISIGSNLITTGAGAKTLTLGAVAGPNNVFSGKISDGGGVISLSVNGLGHWIVSGNNTYTGQTTVSSTATLTLSGDNSGMTGLIQLSTGGTTGPRLNINSATALGTGTLSFGGGLASDTVRIDNTSLGGAVTVSTANAINMGRNFTFIGTEDLSLGTGTTTLSGMAVNINRSITVTAKTLRLGGTIVEATDGNNNGITKAGAGSLLLSGLNTYRGLTTVSAGTLIAGNNSPSGSAGAFGNASSEISLGAAGGSSDASILIGGAFNVGRNIRTATADGTDTGTRVLTLGGNTAHNSEFSGNIILGTASQAGRGVTLTAANSGQVTFSGVIQEPGSMDATTYTVTKAGLGTVVLTNANTYTGTTSVNEGTLLVNNTTASGTGTNTVSVAFGATLGGTGTIAGAVNVTGVLSPGASIQTLGTGALSFANGSTLAHELDSSVGAAVGSDLLKVTGNLNLGGTVGLSLADLAVTDVAFNVDDVFSLINYTGSLTGGGLFSLGGNPLEEAEEFTFGLNTWRINYTAATGGLNFAGEYDPGTTDSFVNLTVIPEPSSVALLATLGGMLLLRRRR